jgi:uncharacterized protein (TIGR02246 family)
MNMWKQVVAGFIVSIPLAPSFAQNAPSNDERAVRAVVQQIAETSHGQTATARDSLFADDAQITNAFGNRAQGREEIDNFWRSMFETGMFRTAKNDEKSLSVRFLTHKLALVDRFYVFSGQRGPKSGRELPPRDIHMTLVLRRDGPGWRIIYYSVADLRSLDREKAARDAK